MKMAKALAILFAMVLVIMCFNAPFVYSGEEHPWDGDGGSNGGISDGYTGPGDDSLVVDPMVKDEGTRGYDPSYPVDPEFLISMQFILWYHDVPTGVSKEENGASNGAYK
jgi:hypothetical protein